MANFINIHEQKRLIYDHYKVKNFYWVMIESDRGIRV
jgi:hypothetical protein